MADAEGKKRENSYTEFLTRWLLAAGSQACQEKGCIEVKTMFFYIALTTARKDERSRAYYRKSGQEGKSLRQALLSLVRQLARVIYHIWKRASAEDSTQDICQSKRIDIRKLTGCQSLRGIIAEILQESSSYGPVFCYT